MKCEKIKIVTALRLLIIRYTAEKRGMFHIHSLIVNLDIEFIHEINPNYEFDELEGHQQLNLIKEILNEDCFEGFIIKVVMFDDNVQELSIVFLKTAIFLLADLQFELSFHD